MIDYCKVVSNLQIANTPTEEVIVETLDSEIEENYSQFTNNEQEAGDEEDFDD